MTMRSADNKGGHITSGFAKVRQSEIVFEYFSEIVHCRICRKAATRYANRHAIEKKI